MSIFTSVFEEDGILMAWGDCPYQYEDGERCEGDILEVCQDMGYHWKCSATISHGFFYSERDRLNIREANKMEVEAYQREKEYRDNIQSDTSQARQLISWWGFEMPTDFTTNHGPGEYMPYEVYLSLVKRIFPKETPLSKSDFDELVWRIWR